MTLMRTKYIEPETSEPLPQAVVKPEPVIKPEPEIKSEPEVKPEPLPEIVLKTSPDTHLCEDVNVRLVQYLVNLLQ